MNAEIVTAVIERVKVAYEYVFAKREKISREAGMEDVRVARENALAHPHLSTTPLPEALERANNVYNKLEREAAPIVKKATIALLAVEQASREVEAVKTALKTKDNSDRSKAALGLYQAAVRVVEKLGDFGAKRWVIRQQGAFEIRIYADLMRWKARNHELDDENSPWLCLKACYASREMDVELDPGERYGTSMPQQVADNMRAKRSRTRLRTFELRPGSVASDQPHSVVDRGPEIAANAENAESAESSEKTAPTPIELPSMPDPPAPPAAPIVPTADSAGGSGSGGDPGAPMDVQDLTPEDFYPVALEIAFWDGTDEAIGIAVGFPDGISTDYEATVRNGEAAIASGSTVPHLREYVQAARERTAISWLRKLREQRAHCLAKRLSLDPDERARARTAGYKLPGD